MFISKPPLSIGRTIAHKQLFLYAATNQRPYSNNRFQKERADNRVCNLRDIGSASVRLAL